MDCFSLFSRSAVPLSLLLQSPPETGGFVILGIGPGTVRGFRLGKDAKGRSYTAAPIPGTGLYNREYSSQGKAADRNPAPLAEAVAGTVSGAAARRKGGFQA